MRKCIKDACDGRKNNFDFIRFIAASMVIYSHAFPLTRGNAGELLNDISNGAWSFGSLAVAVFFIISGFLISQSYCKKNSPIFFVEARVLRIFPGLIVVILLSVFVLGPIYTTIPLSEYFKSSITWTYLKSIFLYPIYWNLPGVFENNFFSPSVNGSLWTIPFEVFFYGVVLFLGILGILREKKISLLGFLCFSILSAFQVQIFPVDGHFLSFSLYSMIELGLYFFAGMTFFAYRDVIVLDRHYAMMSLSFLMICILLGSYAIPFSIFGGYLIMYIAFSEKVKLNSFSKHGDFSYGIYIYGFPVQQAVTASFGGAMNPYLNMAISYPVTMLFAALSWFLIESPCIKQKKWKSPEQWTLWLCHFQERIRKILAVNWIKYVAICCAIGAMLYMNYSVPGYIEMPSNKQGIFLSGWLEQSDSEDYRWVSMESSLKLKQKSTSEIFVVEGFIPESFDEVTFVQVYFDDVLMGEYSFSSGDALSINIPVEKGEGDKTVVVKLAFNAEHIPTDDSGDARVMSALITKIGFC